MLTPTHPAWPLIWDPTSGGCTGAGGRGGKAKTIACSAKNHLQLCSLFCFRIMTIALQMYEELKISCFSAELCLWLLQGRGSRTMGNGPWNVWVLCESDLWLFGPCACLCVFASPPSLRAVEQGAPAHRLYTSPPTPRLSPRSRIFHFMLQCQQNQPGAQNRAWTHRHELPVLPNLPDVSGLCPPPQLRGVRGLTAA